MKIDQLSKGIWRLIDSSYPANTNYVLMNASQSDADFYIQTDRNKYAIINILSYNTNISDSVLTSFTPSSYYSTLWTTKVLGRYNANESIDARKINADTQVKIDGGRFSVLYPIEEVPSYPNGSSVMIDITCPHCGYRINKTLAF